MADFFAELKRRHIYRVAAAYAVVAWVLLQLVNNVAPLLKLPDWAGTFFLVALLVGFPVALIFAWILELRAPVALGAPVRGATTRMDFVIAGALAVVIALILYEQLTPSPGERAAQRQQASVTTGTANAAGISIAVLPFANMSGDAGQEFFSDGMTEEINGALAKVADLHVVARTSAFQFKGQNQDVRSVGQALGASHLIEGSVRKVGDRVRISAQLVRADNGLQLWSENYDRNLTDIFAIQEEIAQAIAVALKVPLGLQQGDTLVRNRTNDLATYDQYLRAKALYRARANDQALAILEPLVIRDASFAPAWALLGYAYAAVPPLSPYSVRGPVEEARRLVQTSFDKAEVAARKSIALDSRYAGGLGVLATVQMFSGKWAQAEDLFKQALALDPNDGDVLARYGTGLAAVGRIKEALDNRRRLLTLEPSDPFFRGIAAGVMELAGQNAEAISILEAMAPTSARNVFLGALYAALGRYADSADILLLPSTDQYSRRAVEDAARIIRSAPAKTNAPESLPAVEGLLNFVYAYVGALPRVLESYERYLDIGYFGNTPGVWNPDYASLRQMERFKAFVRKAGLVDYWRERGWPDLCRPVGANDFVCD